MFKIIITGILLCITSFFIIQRAIVEIKKENQPQQELITIFIKDKEITTNFDCSAVEPIQIQINSNQNKFEKITQYLFTNELQTYAQYQKIQVEDLILKIYLKSDTRPDGRPLTSLSSCEMAHLYSVLEKTFTQFEEIKSVELLVGDSVLEL
jgi:hypothetical protein